MEFSSFFLSFFFFISFFFCGLIFGPFLVQDPDLLPDQKDWKQHSFPSDSPVSMSHVSDLCRLHFTMCGEFLFGWDDDARDVNNTVIKFIFKFKRLGLG